MEQFDHESLTDKVKQISNFYDLINIQTELPRYLTELKLDGIITQIISALEETNGNILLIDQLLDSIFNHDLVRTQEREIDNLELYIQRKYPTKIRLMAISNLVKLRPQKSSILLVNLAIDSQEDQLIRLQAIQTLSQISLNQAELNKLLNTFDENNDELTLTVLKLLTINQNQAPVLEVKKKLEKLLFSANETIKCQAIELLGIFGEIDILEKVCLLPHHNENIKQAIIKLVINLTNKPINLLYIRPENFEHLIKDLLEKIGYLDVEVTPYHHDQGIDIIAYKQGFGINKNQKQRVVVQCKRYRKTPISEEDIRALLKTMQIHQATEGLFITTSNFSIKANQLAEAHRHVQLIDKNQLQKLLNQYFDNKQYCILAD